MRSSGKELFQCRYRGWVVSAIDRPVTQYGYKRGSPDLEVLICLFLLADRVTDRPTIPVTFGQWKPLFVWGFLHSAPCFLCVLVLRLSGAHQGGHGSSHESPLVIVGFGTSTGHKKDAGIAWRVCLPLTTFSSLLRISLSSCQFYIYLMPTLHLPQPTLLWWWRLWQWPRFPGRTSYTPLTSSTSGIKEMPKEISAVEAAVDGVMTGIKHTTYSLVRRSWVAPSMVHTSAMLLYDISQKVAPHEPTPTKSTRHQ